MPPPKDDSAILIYRAVNLINGKFYIGWTSRSLRARANEHRYSAVKLNSPAQFHRAIRKYGIEMMRFSVLSRCAGMSVAHAEERRLIALFNPEYNCTLGGEGQLGRFLSEDAKRRIGAASRGRPNGRKGKKASPEEVARLAFYRPLYQARWDGEWRQLGLQSQRRPVICINTGIIYVSATAAAVALGIRQNSISEICKRSVNRYSVGGYVFRYADEPDTGATAEEIIEGARRRQRSVLRSAKVVAS